MAAAESAAAVVTKVLQHVATLVCCPLCKGLMLRDGVWRAMEADNIPYEIVNITFSAVYLAINDVINARSKRGLTDEQVLARLALIPRVPPPLAAALAELSARGPSFAKYLAPVCLDYMEIAADLITNANTYTRHSIREALTRLLPFDDKVIHSL